MKNFFVFKQTNDQIELIGNSKDEFSSYIFNFDDVMEWQAYEIEEALNSGNAADDHPVVIECLDNCTCACVNCIFQDDDNEVIEELKSNNSSDDDFYCNGDY